MHGDLLRGDRPRRPGSGFRGQQARALAFAIVAAVLCLVASPAVASATVATTHVGGIETTPTESVLWSSVTLTSCPEEEASAPLPPEPMCEVVAIDPDEDGFFAAAPICDPSGASAVAPAPIHPIGDDRLEATPTCADPTSGPAVDRDRGGDAPSERPLTSVDPALLPSTEPPLRARGTACTENPGALLGPAEGVRHRLEQPPT